MKICVTDVRTALAAGYLYASVIDRAYTVKVRRALPSGVREIGTDEHGKPVIRFPAQMMAGRYHVDLGAAFSADRWEEAVDTTRRRRPFNPANNGARYAADLEEARLRLGEDAQQCEVAWHRLNERMKEHDDV